MSTVRICPGRCFSPLQVGTNDLRTAVSVLPDVRSIAIYDANRTLLLNSSNLSPADPNLADVSPFSLPVNSSRGLVLAANAPIMFPIGGGVVIGYVHAVLDAGKFQALVSDGVGLQRTGEVLLGAVDPGTDALRLVLPPSRDPLAPPVQTWQPDRALEKVG